MFYNNYMDDSVIKVLRRNGSWNKTRKTSPKKLKDNLKNAEEANFQLDEKFEILAKEIKKRVIKKSKNNENRKSQNLFKTNSDTFLKETLKKEVLPLLKEVEQLAEEKSLMVSKLSIIDEQLSAINNRLVSLRKVHEEKLNKFKKDIEFFDETIKAVEVVKGGSDEIT